MDSLYGHFYTLRPILSQTLTDYSEVKMLSRTEIIYNEAKRLIGNISDKLSLIRIYCNDVIEYNVSGEKLEVVDIPTGYTHNIINTGDIDMVTVMWANETFDKERPDAYYLEV